MNQKLFSETKVKQLHNEIPKLRTYIVIIRANQKKINVKNNLKQIKSNFFPEKFETRAIKISVLCC